MLLVALAWTYIVVLMAVVEAASPSGTVLGAFFTLLLYGALPLSILWYLSGTRARRARLRSARAEPDRRSHAPGDNVAPEREES